MAFKAGTSGSCPHCKVSVRFELTTFVNGRSSFQIDRIVLSTPSQSSISLLPCGCPNCGRPIIGADYVVESGSRGPLDVMLWPESGARPIPAEVEGEAMNLASDFREASSVFATSKKASAALSRRCLQFILREKAGTKSKDLSAQIDEVLEHLPSELAKNVDAIRHVGNFAAHPLKSTNSGEIVEVEDGEAEWLLDVLEELMDFYYVAPQRAAKRRASLNEKLKDIGKPPLKAP